MGLLKPGNQAPSFHLIDQCSQLISLEDVLSKGPAALLFYQKDFSPQTATCLRAWKVWLEALPTPPPFQLLAISSDEWEHHHQFARQLALPFPVLYDHLGKAGKRYGCQILPVLWSREATFYIDNYGQRIRQTHLGLLPPQEIWLSL